MAATVIPYLMFDGNCDQAFRYYEKVLGAKRQFSMKYGDAPMGPGQTCPDDTKDRIINMSFFVNGVLMMASDTPPGRYVRPQGFGINLQYDSVADAQRVFAGLAEGGQVNMPLEETFFAHSFGMVTDRFGTPWMVIAPKPM